MILYILEIKVFTINNNCISIDTKIIREQRNIGLFNVLYFTKKVNNLEKCPDRSAK